MKTEFSHYDIIKMLYVRFTEIGYEPYLIAKTDNGYVVKYDIPEEKMIKKCGDNCCSHTCLFQ